MGIILAAGILFGAVQYGRKTQREAHRVDELEDYLEVQEAVHEVDRILANSVNS